MIETKTLRKEINIIRRESVKERQIVKERKGDEEIYVERSFNMLLFSGALCILSMGGGGGGGGELGEKGW